MRGQVAIIGVGVEGLSSLSPESSYREMIHAAAVRAYTDAGIEPRAASRTAALDSVAAADAPVTLPKSPIRLLVCYTAIIAVYGYSWK